MARTAILVLLAAAAAGSNAGVALPGTDQVTAGAPADSNDADQRVSARFPICHTGGGTDCVVDGDTAWIGGTKVRVSDIDAPETHPSRCAQEAALDDRATRRLAELMNAGPFEMRSVDRDEDRSGRSLRDLVRESRSLGDMLVAEGLARTWEGRRWPWFP